MLLLTAGTAVPLPWPAKQLGQIRGQRIPLNSGIVEITTERARGEGAGFGEKRFETRVTVFLPLRTRDHRPNSFAMIGVEQLDGRWNSVVRWKSLYQFTCEDALIQILCTV